MHPKILVIFAHVGSDFQAQAFVHPESDKPDTFSPVTGTIEQTLDALTALYPDYRFTLSCIRCGNSEGRDYAVDTRSGVCDFCAMSAGEQERLQRAWAHDELYVYGPPDVEYPPDALGF